MAQPTRVGIVGVGNISSQYFEQLAAVSAIDLVGLADLDEKRAADVAQARGMTARSVEELLSDPNVDVVLNLTVPAAHADIDLAAIAQGKHVYAEKPLALTLEEGQRVLAAARAAGVRVGSAPDTFLGTGLQTSLRALREGEIGEPFAASACWGSPGHELWHPNPQFYYLRGGGPVFDMGPYYLTALVVHLGPVVRVQARHVATTRVRRVASGPLAGTLLRRSVPTHAAAILEHANGAVSTVTLSYETWASADALLTIYGTGGTLRLPDPNWFSEGVEIWRAPTGGWENRPFSAGYANAGRGIGLVEMATAIAEGHPHRASGDLALHVLEIMTAIDAVGDGSAGCGLTTTFEPPELVLPISKPGTRP